MARNGEAFKWSAAKIRAAELVADGRLNKSAIASRAGISHRTLSRLLKCPDFLAKVAELLNEIEQAVLQRGIARRVNRLRALNERHELMQQVLAERSQAPEVQDVPGGKTGLVVIKEAAVEGDAEEDGQEPARVVPLKVAVDVALLREMRETEKQAAIETGQWTEKREHSIPDLDALIAAELARLAGVSQAAAAGAAPADADAQPGADGGSSP